MSIDTGYRENEGPELELRARKNASRIGMAYRTWGRAFAAECKARPGEWLVYPGDLKTRESRASTAQYVKRGRWAAGHGFEARVRGTEVHVRWVGAS